MHLPGSDEPLSCVPGLAAVEDASPIGVAGEFFSVELRPRDMQAWGDVEHESQLEIQVHGLL